MIKQLGFTALLCGAALLVASSTQASVIISENFESGNAATNFTLVDDGTPDGFANFAFDYVAAGIPLAPNSAAGDRLGLQLAVNQTLGAVDALTAFYNVPVNADKYSLSVDVFISFTGTAGTTEHAHVGVGGDGVTTNSLFTPISGSGSYIAFDGDGGSASDYRWYLAPANGGPTTVPNTDPSYLGNGSNNTNPFFQQLFPNTNGSPGNIWTTVGVEVDAGTISYFFDGTLTFQGTYTGNLNGLVSLGLHDPFTSIGTAAGASVFTVFDNLTVTVVPEPSTVALLFGLAAIGLVAARRRA
jgi:hypothetical protein